MGTTGNHQVNLGVQDLNQNDSSRWGHSNFQNTPAGYIDDKKKDYYNKPSRD